MLDSMVYFHILLRQKHLICPFEIGFLGQSNPLSCPGVFFDDLLNYVQSYTTELYCTSYQDLSPHSLSAFTIVNFLV